MSGRTEAQRKQYRLSVGLRIMTIVIAAFAGGLMVVASVIRRSVPYFTSDEVWNRFGFQSAGGTLTDERWSEVMSGHTVFTVIVLLLCIAILYRFNLVCTQIGADNSFSKENAAGFRTMAWLSLAAAGVYAVKIAFYVTRCMSAGSGRAAVILAAIYGAVIVAFLIFAFLCGSLSKLVYNAYEVKLENELTI